MRESFEKYTANNIKKVKEIIANSGILLQWDLASALHHIVNL
jgi:hypothetical protein